MTFTVKCCKVNRFQIVTVREFTVEATDAETARLEAASVLSAANLRGLWSSSDPDVLLYLLR